MSYRIRAARKIRRQLRELPGNVRNIARQRMLSLAGQPRSDDARELQVNGRGCCLRFAFWEGGTLGG